MQAPLTNVVLPLLVDGAAPAAEKPVEEAAGAAEPVAEPAGAAAEEDIAGAEPAPAGG
jgi:hypothetical protein